MNIAMIGTGYVGLTTGLGFAKLGHQVTCVDIDETKVQQLNEGKPTFYEPGLPELLQKMQSVEHIRFTSDLKDALENAEIVAIAVGTPPAPTGEANLEYVFAAADSIGENLDHPVILVTKSTVPIGTNRKILERVRQKLDERNLSEISIKTYIASVPEFLREGKAIEDFFHPDRVVIGSEDEETARIIDELHQGLDAPRVIMGLESAELTKYAANAFLATKISFINEIANVAERVGADVREVAKAIGFDHRIGEAFLKAGIGYGGSCFPKDVSALHQLSGTNGYDFRLLSSVIEVNNRQRDLFVQKVEQVLGGLSGKTLAVWGLAFKAGTDDVRESAAIEIIRRLYAQGATVCAYDPEATKNAREELPEQVVLETDPLSAVKDTDALLILTEWPEFQKIDLTDLKQSMSGSNIFDGRNLLVDLAWEKNGFQYHGVGLGKR